MQLWSLQNSSQGRGVFLLELPPHSKIHQIFHVVLLEKSYTSYTKVSNPV